MRRGSWLGVLAVLAPLAACDPVPPPAYPTSPYAPRVSPVGPAEPAGPDRAPRLDPRRLGALDDRMIDFSFDGGQLEFELYRQGRRIVQVVRNRYAVPVVIRWQMSGFDNADPVTATEGVAVLPAAPAPLGVGPTIVLAELAHLDDGRRYHRDLVFRARFGDPRAHPSPYAYALPYPVGRAFTVLQGFHGSFSHRGSNAYAVDFDCPVATPVLAARPGLVVAAHAAAQGAGQTEEFLDYRRTNFVIVLHDDGTLGEYMHLAPSGIEVTAGQRVSRGQSLGLSGNTGFSSTPHLHFQVMTAAPDGLASRSFPFRIAVAPDRVEEPVQGRRYPAWE